MTVLVIEMYGKQCMFVTHCRKSDTRLIDRVVDDLELLI